MSTVPLLSQLERFLSVTNKRETVIAANMANIDTPGYQTQDIDFQQALTQALGQGNGEPAHVNLRKVRGLLERPDGNNVDMDRESLLLSQTQLQYQLGTQLLKGQFHNLLAAINSGGGQ